MKKTITKLDYEGRVALFCDIIDELCQYSGWQLREIAEEAGVSLSTVYNWIELRTFSPRIDTLTKIAGALGYEIQMVRVEGRRKRLKAVK